MTPAKPGLSAVHLQQAWTSEKGPKLKSEKKRNAVEGFGALEGRVRVLGRLRPPFPPAKLQHHRRRALSLSLLSTPKLPRSKEALLSPSLASSDRLVLSPTAATPLSTAQAGAQRQVAAHAGHEERQGQEGQPAGTAEGVWVAPHRVITGAGLPELSLRVRHAVVEQTLCTPHTGPLAQAVQGRVRGISAAAPPVLRSAEDRAAVHAARRARRSLRTGAVIIGGDYPGVTAAAGPSSSLTSPRARCGQ